MASFAALRRAVGTAPRHALLEFAMMDILMAAGAGPIFEMERQDFVGPSGSTNFVAIGARNSGVRAGQCKTRLAMFGDCECGAVPIQHGVTFRTLALFGPCFELALVGVRFVTIIAITKRQLLFEITFQVAFRTADHGVLSEERVLGLGMVEFKAR